MSGDGGLVYEATFPDAAELARSVSEPAVRELLGDYPRLEVDAKRLDLGKRENVDGRRVHHPISRKR